MVRLPGDRSQDRDPGGGASGILDVMHHAIPHPERPRAHLQRLAVTSVTILIALLAIGAGARADGFSDPFAARIDAAGPGELVTGILMLEEQIDLPALEVTLRAPAFATRWRRHAHVLTEARELAARSQRNLLADLEARHARGEIASYRPFWVVNAVAVTAPASVFHALAARGDVAVVEGGATIEMRASGTVSPSPGGTTAAGTGVSGVAPRTGEANPHVAAVRAPQAWAMGYTGRGRLVAQLDWAPDGDHPALVNSWRGRRPEVPWYHAWNDPSTRATEAPNDFNTHHGSQVLGIMVARPPGEDPIGVAHEAEWIAGDIRGVDTPGLLGLFEWIADPDSNVATVDDVPDVVNNSWGTDESCSETFWAAIDLVEAAGIANVIAVANSGEQGPGSVKSPESRAETPYQNFSVGAIDAREVELPLYYRSGLGPSLCDEVSIKPELTAPGVGVITTDVSFGTPSIGPVGFGTSMSAPFVSGAIALLRQADPDLPVDAAKDLLMATALDRGPYGEDNGFGHGVLDVASAIQLLLHQRNPRIPPRLAVATRVERDSVEVTWTAPFSPTPTDSVTAYRIYRAREGELFPVDPVAEVSASARAFTDPDLAPGGYLYVITAVFPGGESGPTRTARATILGPVRSDGSPGLVVAPSSARLRGAPNPFAPSTVLRLSGAPRAGRVTVTLHDVGGREVRELTACIDARGTGEVRWDGRGEDGRPVPAGVYFARIRVDGVEVRERLVRVR